MSDKLLKRIIGGVVFLISVSVLFSTVQPSVSFWDCGEFLAAAHFLQVPHPPGAPFFLILARIFQMIPFVANIALRMNTLSVLTSAMTIIFLYFIIIMLVRNYQGNKPQSRFSSIVTYTAAAIGALSFSFSDTFWFNGVEAELYALSICLAAYIIWLILRWNINAEKSYAEQYVLMIAYLIGIAAAVHLMSVLLVTPVVMIIIFRKYITDEEITKQSGYILLGHIALILLIAFAMWQSQTSTTPPTQAEFEAYDTKFIMIMVGISIVYMGIFYKKILNRSSIYVPIVIGGVSLFVVYPGIVKDLPGIMNTIAGNDVWAGFITFLIVLGILAYGVRYSIQNKKPTLHLISMSLILILVGFASFAMVIIRANAHPPMDENEPDEFPELVSYLNRTQYGDFPIFDRRFADDGMHPETWQNYKSNLDFFWRYQMNHMETRYWLWNYAGRSSWDQDAGPDIAPFNGIGNTIGSFFGIHFEGNVANSLYGIPFLLGLLGIYFHFKDDWKMAAVLMVMFLLMGYLTAFYQNQQEPQPRERDYFYVGAFFVFSIWIGIAVQGLADLVRQKMKPEKYKNAAIAGVLALAIIFVPINMYKTNYFTHDRSHNWVPWDYSYNILQSCAPNAILFTNGDNDTFPLWYLQDIEGVRRDVKIVNLSLLNTPWYISELKNNDPYHVGKVNINLTDQQIQDIQPIRWATQNITIPGPNETEHASIKDVYQEYKLTDSTTLKNGSITFKMEPTLNFGDVKAIRVQDIMVKQIVQDNHWQRPIYFSVTCSEDSKIGLDDYLRLEGMASRLVPQKGNGGFEFIQPTILKEQIEGNKGYSKTYKPGFKFRGLNNPHIFYDQNHQRMLQNYRNAFLALAFYDVNNNKNDSAIAALNLMEQKMPRSIIPVDNGILYNIGNLYSTAGENDSAAAIYKEVENTALNEIKENPSNLQSYNNPYRILIELYSHEQEYGKLADIWEKIETYYPDDPSVKANVQRYRILAKYQKERKDSMAMKPKGK
jgi:Protein O-mannosyl-transferase TMEM260-like